MIAAEEVPLLQWNLNNTKLTVTCVVLFLCFHFWYFGGDLRSLHFGLWRKFLAEKETTDSKRREARVDKEVLRIRQQLLVFATTTSIHAHLLVQLWSVYEFYLSPGVGRALQMALNLVPYVLHGLVSRRGISLTPRNLRIVKSLYFLNLNTFVLCQSMEEQGTTDPVAHQIFQVSVRFMMTILFLDTPLVISMQVVSSISECWAYWKFKGDLQLVQSFFVGQGLVCFALAVMSVAFEITVRWYVRASLESADAGSMVNGFRKVLRGICDGDVLLDGDLRIQGKAQCLQHILLSATSSFDGKSFCDLLDQEERDRFENFLRASTKSAAGGSEDLTEGSPSAPSCLRVSLLGSCNTRVGVDLFHVAVVDKMREETLHLLAFREDSEARGAPPDASQINSAWVDEMREKQALDHSPHGVARQTNSRASGSSIGLLPACTELAELTLLVDVSTPLLDVQQAHLRYRRRSDDPETDMPCLRSMVVSTDWETVRSKTTRYMRKLHEKKTTEPKSMSGMRLKMPNDPRTYMIARGAQLLPWSAKEDSSNSLPDKLWLHLTDFLEDSSRCRPTPGLVGIQEARR